MEQLAPSAAKPENLLLTSVNMSRQLVYIILLFTYSIFNWQLVQGAARLGWMDGWILFLLSDKPNVFQNAD